MSLKSAVKGAIAAAWDATAAMHSPGSKLTILYYHAVPADLAGAFEAQMAYLKRTANLVRADHTGPLTGDRPNVAVTFDDAFRSVRENALPALERHAVPATIFVPTGFLGRQPGWKMETTGDKEETVMSGEEIARLPTDLIAIGSHTIDHPHLTKLSDAEVIEQFAASRATLEALLGRTVDTLAFPYGDHDARVVESAREVGYRFVYTVAPQAIAAGDTAISRGRTAADPGDSPRLFALKTRGAFDWMPMASALKRRLRPRS
jgi:peptidoglycan/xylan/chitin deacetylase (PgdA/CDA1 family)